MNIDRANSHTGIINALENAASLEVEGSDLVRESKLP